MVVSGEFNGQGGGSVIQGKINYGPESKRQQRSSTNTTELHSHTKLSNCSIKDQDHSKQIACMRSGSRPLKTALFCNET